MNTYVVWIEMNCAKTFKVCTDGTRARILRRREIKHHASRDQKKHKNCEKFFHELAELLKDA